MKKVNFFCHSFQKLNLHIFHYTYSEIFQAFISYNFDEYG